MVHWVKFGLARRFFGVYRILVAFYNEVMAPKGGFSVDSIGTHGMENPLLIKIGLAQNPKAISSRGMKFNKNIHLVRCRLPVSFLKHVIL
jgi:hypothetical protein